MLIDADDKKIFVTHGHMYNVKYDHNYHTMKEKGLSIGADAVIFGHTHIPYCENFGNILLLNPGSVKSEQKFVFGVATRNPLNPAETFIYDNQGKFLYKLKGKLVYNEQNEEVGIFRRNVLTDMYGKRLGKIDADGNFVAEMVRVIPLIALNDGDVLHISVIEQ